MLDHLLIGVSDLAAGIRDIAARTGIEPQSGGRHPRHGTHNALLSLGEQRYLEIIAPDPGNTPLADEFRLLAAMTAPRLFTWAAHTDHLRSLDAELRAAGYATSGPLPGSRQRVDGTLLSWETLWIRHAVGLAAPFFIQWADMGQHPGQTTPGGCRLEAFTITHPQAADLNRLLEIAGMPRWAISGATPALRAELATPNGSVIID